MFASIQSAGVSILISIMNAIISQIVILLINQIRYNYVTQEKREIMVNVFMAQFVNTGILLLLTTANFEGTVLSFIPINKNYSDFTAEWYVVTGKALVNTMTISAFMPFILMGIAKLRNLIKQWLDKFKA